MLCLGLDLFSQAIQSSGSAFNEWSLSDRSVEMTRVLGETFGCNDVKQLKECLKSKDAESLIEAIREMVSFLNGF